MTLGRDVVSTRPCRYVFSPLSEKNHPREDSTPTKSRRLNRRWREAIASNIKEVIRSLAGGSSYPRGVEPPPRERTSSASDEAITATIC